jgi:hypothetical protein
MLNNLGKGGGGRPTTGGKKLTNYQTIMMKNVMMKSASNLSINDKDHFHNQMSSIDDNST